MIAAKGRHPMFCPSYLDLLSSCASHALDTLSRGDSWQLHSALQLLLDAYHVELDLADEVGPRPHEHERVNGHDLPVGPDCLSLCPHGLDGRRSDALRRERSLLFGAFAICFSLCRSIGRGLGGSSTGLLGGLRVLRCLEFRLELLACGPGCSLLLGSDAGRLSQPLPLDLRLLLRDAALLGALLFELLLLIVANEGRHP